MFHLLRMGKTQQNLPVEGKIKAFSLMQAILKKDEYNKV